MKLVNMAMALNTLLLLSCGGGGGGTGVTGSSTIYPLSTILANYVNNPFTVQVTIAGSLSSGGQIASISGSGSQSESTSNSTFGGVSALQKKQIVAGIMSVNLNGQTQSAPLNGITYYYFNTNYQTLGKTTSEGQYCVTTNTSSIPMNVTPGQSGDWYKMNCYTNSSRAVLVATLSVSYSVEAVSENTANLIINLATLDSSTKINLPTKETYLITTSGSISYKESSANISSGGETLTLVIKTK